MYKIIILTAISLSISLNLSAQKSKIKVYPQDTLLYTGDKLIHDLVSSGVKIVNIKNNFNPESHVMGYFTDPTRYLGIEHGIILSTGVVDNVAVDNKQDNYTSFESESVSTQSKGVSDVAILEDCEYELIPGTILSSADSYYSPSIITSSSNYLKEGDSDLSSEIEGLQTFDARVIEVEFIPSSDSLYYRYVFASEEYDEYVCSPFNDVFAFYLFEKGKEKTNIALVPRQNIPVSINNVNNGNPNNANCPKNNSHLYQKNNGTQNLLYDGFTKVLDIRQNVTPGKKYILKIAIADASDGFWDSAVLLENGSLFSYIESFEVQFEKNSSESNEDDYLKEVLNTISRYPSSKIQLIGHSNQSGSESHNYELSKQRVIEIKNYLIDNNVSEDRIVQVFKGESMPRYQDDNLNRRVEIFITSE